MEDEFASVLIPGPTVIHEYPGNKSCGTDVRGFRSGVNRGLDWFMVAPQKSILS
jgi:hypothetical protein